MYSQNKVVFTSIILSPVVPIVRLSTVLSNNFCLCSSSLPQTWWQWITQRSYLI